MVLSLLLLEAHMAEIRIDQTETLEPEAREIADRLWTNYDDEFGDTFERRSFAFTARRDGRVVGVATGWRGMGMAYLFELIVDPELRGQGIGARLLAAFEALAQAEGQHRLALMTARDRPARQMYQHHGWQIESELPNWFSGQTYVHMRKDV